MVQPDAIDYVRRLLQQGYDKKTITQTLLQSRYTQEEIDTIFKILGHSKVITTTHVAIAIGIVTLIVLFIIIIMTVTQEPAYISATITPFNTAYAPGQTLIATLTVATNQETGNAIINYLITGPTGKITGKTEKLTISDQSKIPLTLTLPNNILPGEYKLNIDIAYGSLIDHTTAQFVISGQQTPTPTIQEPQLQTPQAQQTEQTCPFSCEDNNICTTDYCQNGICLNQEITPCCGNGICEIGETCPTDCKPLQAPTTQCETKGQQQLIDSCYKEQAETTRNKNYCANIIDADQRDACYIRFAYEKDYTVCQYITNSYIKRSCTNLEKLNN